MLIQGAIAGSTDCFSRLMDRHMPAVKRHLRFKISNDADLEDVLQEVLLKVWLHLGQFRSESSVRTWMTRVAINEARQSYRRSKRMPFCQPLDDSRDITSTSELPDQRLIRAEAAADLHRAVSQLPEKYRDVVIFRNLREISIKETAEVLQTTSAATKTRLFRALLMLSTKVQRSETRELPSRKPVRDRI